jgi:hypothetical protein
MPFLAETSEISKLEVSTSSKLLISPASTLRYPGGAGKAVNPFYARNLNLKFKNLPRRIAPRRQEARQEALLTPR